MNNTNKINFELKRLLKNSLKNSFHPEKNILYHYTNIESLKSIIMGGRFRASNAMFLNDKLEVVHLRKLVRGISAEVSNSLSRADQASFTNFVEGLFDHTIRILAKDIFILSFSSKFDSLPLWNNFGKNDGYCLGFDFDKFIDKFRNGNHIKLLNTASSIGKELDTSVFFNNVEYIDSLKIKRLREYVELLFKIKDISNKASQEEESKELINIISLQILLIGYFSKENCFSDEHEFRVIIYIKDSPRDIIKYRIYNGIIIPFIEIELKDKTTELLPIKEIVIGPKINIDIAKEGIDYFLKKVSYKKIKILNSKIPLRY